MALHEAIQGLVLAAIGEAELAADNDGAGIFAGSDEAATVLEFNLHVRHSVVC